MVSNPVPVVTLKEICILVRGASEADSADVFFPFAARSTAPDSVVVSNLRHISFWEVAALLVLWEVVEEDKGGEAEAEAQSEGKEEEGMWGSVACLQVLEKKAMWAKSIYPDGLATASPCVSTRAGTWMKTRLQGTRKCRALERGRRIYGTHPWLRPNTAKKSISLKICLVFAKTGADAVISAKGVLYNSIFHPSSLNALSTTTLQDKNSPPPPPPLLHTFYTNQPPARPLALVRAQRIRTSPSAPKGHLFKILRPAQARPAYWDLCERLRRLQACAPRRLADEGEAGVSEKKPQW
ncbi:hypothetical protein D9615_010656 [Tricholomella constricta]|uniref:Uncharacterized protein n=1 Tax=Tricholomella constricta TaxID=117010 RepID=A0A8H5GJG2_9AGAR|nr:hypothetical protein D9615_010656 [Tricholomella constricta]